MYCLNITEIAEEDILSAAKYIAKWSKKLEKYIKIGYFEI